MNREYLHNVVQKYADRIRKRLDRLPGSFDPEDIHEFRVDYKKLRAFIRLLHADAPQLQDMPDAWKKIYRKSGVVRDLQIFLPSLAAWLPENAPLVLRENQQLFQAKEKLIRALEACSFEKEVNRLLKALPEELSDEGLQRFTLHQQAALNIQLLTVEADRDFHRIRKILKDLLYIIRIYEKEWGIRCPISQWKTEKTLDDLAAALGNYQDAGMMLDRIDEKITRAPSADEQSLLIEVRDDRLDEKLRLREQLLDLLQKHMPGPGRLKS